MLELINVSKHFSSIPAVDNVSFSARPGEVTGYLGPNGSGKSTTMKMITGLIEMTSGHIFFGGKPITIPPAALRTSAELRSSCGHALRADGLADNNPVSFRSRFFRLEFKCIYSFKFRDIGAVNELNQRKVGTKCSPSIVS